MAEKNALNEFAISFGSVIVLLPTRNSFRKSGLLLDLFNVSLIVDCFCHIIFLRSKCLKIVRRFCSSYFIIDNRLKCFEFFFFILNVISS